MSNKCRRYVVIAATIVQALCLSTFAAERKNTSDEVFERVNKIATAIARFRNENHRAYPNTLETLVPRYLKDADLQIQSSSPIWAYMDRMIYLHRQGYRDPVNGMKIIAVTSKIAGRDVYYLCINENCEVRGLNNAAYQLMLGRLSREEANKKLIRRE